MERCKFGDFFMRGRRGLSAVIVTLLLVMLAIVLVGIVFVVVNNVVRSGASQVASSTQCLGSQLEVSAYTCAQDGSQCNVTVERMSGNGAIGGVRLVFSDDLSNSNISDSNGNIAAFATKGITVNNVGIINVTKVDAIVYFLSSSGTPEVCSSTGGTIGVIGLDGTTGTSTRSYGSFGSTGGSSSGGGGTTGGTCVQDSSCDSLCGAVGTGYSNNGGTTCYSDSSCSSVCTSPVGNSCTSNSDCGTGYTCDLSTGKCQCVPQASSYFSSYCSSNNYQCGIFSVLNGTCGSVNVNCATGTQQDGCTFPTYCNSTYQCQAPQLLNSGTILSAWPTGAARFFDSNDLPKSQSADDLLAEGAQYQNLNSFVRFPGSNDTNCTQIASILYEPQTDRSFVSLSLNVGDYANITGGDFYKIWDTLNGCLNDTSTTL